MNKALQKYDAIIFDMDGTLVDSMPSHMEAWRRTAKLYQFPFDAEWQMSLGGVPTVKIAAHVNQRYGLQLDCEEVAETKRQQWTELEQPPVLINDVYQVLLTSLTDKKIAVGTGSIRAHAEDVLTQVGVLDKLLALVTASDVTFGKPHPETFLAAAQQMQVTPARCVVFEDTDIGEQAALAAGMDCIRVDLGKIRWPE
ncbi:beta-phosphoglucomutase family hydrolase [Neiella marina]|uniref:Beta-phosphoglucomutase family hydrolase n=1 Tax=Neiella holothuriorum TaxID=2870530 RepID=A0ABS7EC69_9GAMM|nr:beta-phosphoglucomutase family hydrolase [Neiella holothuriorum]MBW8189927.1 beta-phosphoglucomutase family hydrolase [Neiella holothuriorum]